MLYWVKAWPLGRPLVTWWWGEGGDENLCHPTIGSHCLLVSLCLWSGSLTLASQCSTPDPEMGQGGGQDCYLPSSRSVRLILIKPQRLGKLISLEGGPWCSTESFFLPCGKHMGSFLWSSLWEPGGTARGKPHNCVWAPLCLGIPGAFPSQIGYPWADSTSI